MPGNSDLDLSRSTRLHMLRISLRPMWLVPLAVIGWGRSPTRRDSAFKFLAVNLEKRCEMLKRGWANSLFLLTTLSFSSLVNAFLYLPHTDSTPRSLLSRQEHCALSSRTRCMEFNRPARFGNTYLFDFKRFPSSKEARSCSVQYRPGHYLQAVNNGMSDGETPRPVLTKILQKTQRLYTTITNFLITRLRLISSLKPQYFMAIILASVLLSGLFRGTRSTSAQPRPVEVPYSAFLSKVKVGEVAEAQISVSSVAFRSKDGLVYITRIPRAPPDLVNVLDANQEQLPMHIIRDLFPFSSCCLCVKSCSCQASRLARWSSFRTS